MLYGEIIAVCSQISTKHIIILYGQMGFECLMSDGRMATMTSQIPSVMARRKQFPDIGVTFTSGNG